LSKKNTVPCITLGRTADGTRTITTTEIDRAEILSLLGQNPADDNQAAGQ
jgi:hypothetical protein